MNASHDRRKTAFGCFRPAAGILKSGINKRNWVHFKNFNRGKISDIAQFLKL